MFTCFTQDEDLSDLHDVVDVLHSAEPLRPQLEAGGDLQLREASLEVELDALVVPTLPPAETVRRLIGGEGQMTRRDWSGHDEEECHSPRTGQR